MAVCTVLGLEEGKECTIVGTLYKHMKLKPSILDEYSKTVVYLSIANFSQVIGYEVVNLILLY